MYAVDWKSLIGWCEKCILGPSEECTTRDQTGLSNKRNEQSLGPEMTSGTGIGKSTAQVHLG